MIIINYDEAYNYIFNEIGDEGFTLLSFLADDNIQEGLRFIKELTSCDDNVAKLIWVDLKCDYGTKENNSVLQAREEYQKEKAIKEFQYRNNAECPYCRSRNTKKISTTAKVMNTAVWGIFGTKRFKEWHCNQCNSDF